MTIYFNSREFSIIELSWQGKGQVWRTLKKSSAKMQARKREEKEEGYNARFVEKSLKVSRAREGKAEMRP